MAQKNATPTKEQAAIMAGHGLSRHCWVVVKDLAGSMIVKHRITGEFKMLEKGKVKRDRSYWERLPEEQAERLRARGLDVIDTVLPAPDSQFRLRPCGCGSSRAVYLLVREDGQECWRVRCMACGRTSEPFPVRHDAQGFWNTNMAAKMGGNVNAR